ncbi:MAG: hypothetical protein NTW55_00690 [Planctomycetota bacterium]|nr:hypothetical protein [Planctomycetota bacterium]
MADLFPKIKRFLTCHIPNFTDKVESRHSDINKKIEEIVAKCSHNPCNPPSHPAIPYSGMYELRRDIELLVGDLRYCVKEAKGTESGKVGDTTQAAAETKQNTTLAKCWKKIKAFLWKLYEKTIKAFFEAILNKYSPS